MIRGGGKQVEWAMPVHTLRAAQHTSSHDLRVTNDGLLPTDHLLLTSYLLTSLRPYLLTYLLTFLRFFISRYSSSKLAPTMVMGSESTTKPQNMTSMAVSCPMKVTG